MFSEHVQADDGDRPLSRSERGERTRAKVVDCAQRLFLQDGYAGTTIRKIAAEAGVSVGTVMGVGDKDTLLLAAYDGWISAAQASATGLPDGRDAAQRIGRFVQPFLTMFELDLPLSREYGSVLARGTHQTEVFSWLADDMIDKFTTIFAEAGLGDHAPSAARGAYLTYLGLLMSSAARGEGMSGVRTQLEDVVRVLARME